MARLGEERFDWEPPARGRREDETELDVGGGVAIDDSEVGMDENVDIDVAEVGIGGKGGRCDRFERKPSDPFRCRPAKLRIEEEDMLSRDGDFSCGILLASGISVQSDEMLFPSPKFPAILSDPVLPFVVDPCFIKVVISSPLNISINRRCSSSKL